MEFHEYSKLLSWLFQRSRGLGADCKLERMQLALSDGFLSSLHLQYPTIHIAGTNGKGSVSTKIAEGLKNKGHKVGLYTSPHISSVCERIQINGVPITPSSFLTAFQKINKKLCFDEFPLTFFEIVTLLAFQIFYQERVDIAVFETGLGGKYDATNVIRPILSIITSISLDHEHLLGTTIEMITQEKAGIIKEGTPILIGSSVEKNIIESIAFQKNAPLYQVSKEDWVSYDDENSAIAEYGLQLLPNSFSPSYNEIQRACKVRPSCRCEEVLPSTLQQSPFLDIRNCTQPIILDVAHNPDGMRRLSQMLERKYGNREWILLFAGSRDKNISQILVSIFPMIATYIFPDIDSSPRLLSGELVVLEAHKLGILDDKIIKASSLQEALVRYAIPLAEEKKLPILITGSFFIMSEIRELLGYKEFQDPIFSNEASV